MNITQREVESYRSYLIEEEKARGTVALYLARVKEFAAFMQGREVTKERVLAYKAQILETCAPATANGKLGTVNLFLRYLGAPECCVKRLRIQKQFYLPEERQLRQEEYVRLVQTAQRRGDERMVLCLQILCASGIRVS